jgi:Crp-like helix-turn-helix domain
LSELRTSGHRGGTVNYGAAGVFVVTASAIFSSFADKVATKASRAACVVGSLEGARKSPQADPLLNAQSTRLIIVWLEVRVLPAPPRSLIGKFSQETLAEMIGTTRSRVSFFMNKFRKLGYIEYNEKLEIRNSLLNVVLYDKPEIRKNDASGGPR